MGKAKEKGIKMENQLLHPLIVCPDPLSPSPCQNKGKAMVTCPEA
jgi:hypothetical protein